MKSFRPDSAAALLRTTEHRPYPLPDRPWVLKQTWRELLFAHWPVAPKHLRLLLPPELEMDTFDGEAWVGLVPFRMEGVRPHFLPAVPRLSAFAEFNVRTYVRFREQAGVYFFSLDASSSTGVRLARRVFHLPYFDAHMVAACDGGTVDYYSYRTHRGARPAVFVGSYRSTGPEEQAGEETLTRWLTERYCFFTTDADGRIVRGEIHHAPWPLQPAEAEIRTSTAAVAAGIDLPDTAPLLHYAERIDMLGWMPERLT